MHRIDTPSRQLNKFGAGKDGYTNGTPGITPPTETDDEAFDAFQEELLGPIETMKITPTKGTNTQLSLALTRLFGRLAISNFSEIANAKNFGLNAVAFFGLVPFDKFVAVGAADGADAYILYSSDYGYTWAEAANAKNFSLYGVAHGNAMWVAVGAADGGDAYVLTSPDGVVWTERANPKNFALHGVVYADSLDLWVAVGGADGTDAYIVTSADNGVTWTERANPKNIGLNAVAYHNGLIVAAGNPDGTDPYIVTSTNGTAWAEQTPTVARNTTLRGVAYGGSLWVAVGDNFGGTYSYVITSSDGITWTERNASSSDADLYAVCYGPGGIWLAVGETYGGLAGVLISMDGVTWTYNPTNNPLIKAVPKQFDLAGVIAATNLWIAVGEADGTDAYVVRSLQIPVLP